MKRLLIILLALTSLSAFGKVNCETVKDIMLSKERAEHSVSNRGHVGAVDINSPKYLNTFTFKNASATDLSAITEDLNDRCGDTWCEGDYDWNHDNLQCDFVAKKCTMDLTLIDKHFYGDDGPLQVLTLMGHLSKYDNIDFDPDSEEVYVLYNSVCEIPNVSSISDLSDIKYSVIDCVEETQGIYRRLISKYDDSSI